MRAFRYTLAAAALALAAPAAAQNGAHPTAGPAVSAHRATDVVLDGRLDEAVWSTPEPATGFRQQDPREGEPASRTEVRFAYDDGALYVGARMYDSLGVSRQLTRRDAEVESDWIQ
ncbi:MAG TPA: hypothetical protein VF006_06865, partial [Longimicrobium sp.]